MDKDKMDDEKAYKIGKWMFISLNLIMLIFYWWIIWYDHGVAGHYG